MEEETVANLIGLAYIGYKWEYRGGDKAAPFVLPRVREQWTLSHVSIVKFADKHEVKFVPPGTSVRPSCMALMACY